MAKSNNTLKNNGQYIPSMSSWFASCSHNLFFFSVLRKLLCHTLYNISWLLTKLITVSSCSRENFVCLLIVAEKQIKIQDHTHTHRNLWIHRVKDGARLTVLSLQRQNRVKSTRLFSVAKCHFAVVEFCRYGIFDSIPFSPSVANACEFLFVFVSVSVSVVCHTGLLARYFLDAEQIGFFNAFSIALEKMIITIKIPYWLQLEIVFYRFL